MPSMRPLRTLSFIALAILSTGVALAQGTPTKGEQAVTYRKALYQVIVWDVVPMGGMAQDKIPFDKAEFARRAQNVANFTPLLASAYPPESQGVANSKLKDEMWSNKADFDTKMQALVDTSAKLAAVSKTGDVAQMKAAYFDMGNSCKACHDKYRNK